MRRALRITAWGAAGMLALLCLLIGALLVIGNSDSGRALLVRLTSELTRGRVQLAGIHGSFPAALDLDRLQLSDERGIWLFAERISLRWSPMALLARRIQVESLHVGLLHMERRPLPDKEQKPSHTPRIPHTDLYRLNIDRLELGPELAGAPTSLVVRASAHLRSLQDAIARVVAQRTGGIGNYELQLKFDPVRMDATLTLREPAHGPLENLLKVPGLGDLSVLARLNGPREAERVEIILDAGELRGRAHGTFNLKDTAADVEYLLTAPQMSPYAGLSWQNIDLRGRWRGTFKTPSAQGRLRATQLQIPGGLQLGTLSADLNASSGALTAQAVIDGILIPGPRPGLLAGAPLTLTSSIRLDDPLRPAELRADHRLFMLRARGQIAAQQSADIDLRLPDVAPLAAFAAQQATGDATIKARVVHDAASTRLTADVSATINGGTAVWAGLVRGSTTRLQLTGRVSETSLALEKLQLTGVSLALSGSGAVARSAARETNAHLDLSLGDLTRLSPALTGTLKLSARVSGPASSLSAVTDLTSTLSVRGSPTGTVSASARLDGLPKAPRGTLEAHGDLDGAPLVMNVMAQPQGNGLIHAVVRNADWKSAHLEGELTAAAAALQQGTGNAHLRLGQLGDLNRLIGSTLQGSLMADLTLQPAAGHPHADLRLDARDLVTGGVSSNAQLTAEGTLDVLDIKATAQSVLAGEPASLTAAAQLNLPAHQLNIGSAEAKYHGQSLRLLSPAALSFAQGVSIDSLRLGAQHAVLELSGRLSPVLDARASLQQLQPQLINAFVPSLLASGTIQAEAQVQGSFAAPTGHVQLDATGLRSANDVALGLPAADLHASAKLLGRTAAVDAKLAAGSTSHLALNGQVPLSSAADLDLKLGGHLDVALLNPMMEARGRHVTGGLTVDTTITGTAAAPEIGGTVRLANGSLRDYTQGTNLTDITGELSGSHGMLRIESLTARATSGSVSVAGTIGVLQPKIPVDLKVTARNAQPIASNIVTANLNADIQVTGTAREQLEVGGNIHINRADVEIPSGLPPNVAVLDVRRPGHTPPPVTAKPLIIALDVTVDAPRQILVKGRGLDAEMGGQIHVRGTTETPLVSGAFELQRGFFTLASSKLTFSNGAVTFNGAGLKNKIDPTLDFTAQTTVLDVTATVRITGLADLPKIELSSTPELPQDEILARLLFGESASQLSALQVVQIGTALATLGGGGGAGFNPVAKIQKALGLDRLAVGSGATTGPPGAQQNTGASIEAGRYVSSRVFVAVKESTTGTSQLAVDVDLTKHFKLQTRLGNGTAAQGTTPENDPGSSVGLAYQFEY